MSRFRSIGDWSLRRPLGRLIGDLSGEKEVSIDGDPMILILTTRLLNHLAVRGFFSNSMRPMLFALRMYSDESAVSVNTIWVLGTRGLSKALVKVCRANIILARAEHTSPIVAYHIPSLLPDGGQDTAFVNHTPNSGTFTRLALSVLPKRKVENDFIFGGLRDRVHDAHDKILNELDQIVSGEEIEDHVK